MAFAIKRRTHLNGTNFEPFFYPAFFLLQLNLIYMKRILHLVPVKIIILKSSHLIIGSKLTMTSIFSHIHIHLNYYVYAI